MDVSIGKPTRNGGFLKWGYPQIFHFDRMFHYKPSSYWVYTYLWKPLNGGCSIAMLD
jgi:hypothetical protein